MKRLDKLTLAAITAAGLFAVAVLSAQANGLSSKEVLTRTVIATPTTAHISGKSIDARAFSSKASVTKATRAIPANAQISGTSVNALAYSSKPR